MANWSQSRAGAIVTAPFDAALLLADLALVAVILFQTAKVAFFVLTEWLLVRAVLVDFALNTFPGFNIAELVMTVFV